MPAVDPLTVNAHQLQPGQLVAIGCTYVPVVGVERQEGGLLRVTVQLGGHAARRRPEVGFTYRDLDVVKVREPSA